MIQTNFFISQINTIKADNHLIILTGENDDLNNFDLSANEQSYIKEQFNNSQNTVLINQYKRIIFVQKIENKEQEFQTNEAVRKAANKLLKQINNLKISEITLVHTQEKKAVIKSFAEGFLLSNYQFLKYFSNSEEKKNTLKTLNIYSKIFTTENILDLKNTIEAVYRTRNLVNEPHFYLNSLKITEEFQKLANDAGFSLEVFDKQKIEALKMNGLLAVNQGSNVPPTFSVATWKPENAKNKKPLVLVGKGVVFDTGGYSLKGTSNSMDYMKCDMAGSATAMGVIYAIAKNKLPVYAIALVPATDNYIGAKAYVPGDIITYSNKKTVEVLNTDAEGRLILADALCYAQTLKPELVIDFATLTGAAMRAIGKQAIAVMGTAKDEDFCLLEKSGETTYERIVRFPLWDDYDDEIKSDIADIKNIGNANAGAITAGKFLEHFTDYPWIHLDIATNAYLKTEYNYRGKNGTGIGVRLVIDFINEYLSTK